jgi:hypothetical protein
MKEFAKEYLASLTDEERLAYFEGMNKADIWKMAEGKPHHNSKMILKCEFVGIDFLTVENIPDNSVCTVKGFVSSKGLQVFGGSGVQLACQRQPVNAFERATLSSAVGKI